MDARRVSRAVIDPKVRHVGFFTPTTPQSPRPEPAPLELGTARQLSESPATNSLSPVMIPPPRHLSERTAAMPVPESGFRHHSSGDHVPVGSYNASESLLGISPAASPSTRVGFGDGEFSEDNSTGGWFLRSSSGKFDSSFPGEGSDLSGMKPTGNSAGNDFKVGTDVQKRAGVSVMERENSKEKREEVVKEVNHNQLSSSKPLKAKTTKAERRALQEAQRAAKALSKAEGNKAVSESGKANPGKNMEHSSQKKDDPPVASSVSTDKKTGDRSLEKERKKDAPPPRMQFDDKNRVEKAKRRAFVNHTEARNRVELFRHLPQYEHGNQLSNLELKIFLLDSVHPAVFKVGVSYLTGDISRGNARCVAMLRAFQEAIKDYSTPPEKALVRDLTAKISSYVSFFTECRPLSISMGNAIRFVKNCIAKLPLSHSESEAKASLCSDIERFINEKIVLANKVIVEHASTKVRDGDVLLTYGSSGVVEMILLYAHQLGKHFRVVVVDSHPKLEGQALLRRLLANGLTCTYTHINAVSHIMPEVTRVFLGASAVLSNGTVYSRIGSACVAMVAHAFCAPVLICCEAYKFHERVQLDSICSNELADPDAIARVPGRMDVNYLENWASKDNLQLLNLMYDVTPSDYVSMIVTEYGLVPPTSVPVIAREYCGEYFLM